MLPPFYYKDNPDEALFASFTEVIERVGTEAFDLYLYHFPRLSGVPITPGLIERLLARYPDTLKGVKDSSGDWSNTRMLIERFPELAIFPGRRDPAAAGPRGRWCGLHQRILQRQSRARFAGSTTTSAPASPGSASSRRRSPPCARSCSCGR